MLYVYRKIHSTGAPLNRPSEWRPQLLGLALAFLAPATVMSTGIMIWGVCEKGVGSLGDAKLAMLLPIFGCGLFIFGLRLAARFKTNDVMQAGFMFVPALFGVVYLLSPTPPLQRMMLKNPILLWPGIVGGFIVLGWLAVYSFYRVIWLGKDDFTASTDLSSSS